MAKLNPFQALAGQGYFDPLDPNADPRTPGDPNAGRLPQYTAQPAQAPFQPLMNQMPQQGWSNPNAQAWTQQALSGPYMSGWNPVTGGPAGPAPAGSGPGQPLTPDQKALISKQASAITEAKRNSLYGGVLSGLATGGPIGAGISLATSAIGNFFNTGGWFDSGLDGKWAGKTMEEYGWFKGPKGSYRRPRDYTPDGKPILNGHWSQTVAGSKAVAELMSLIQQHNLTPKKS